MKNPIIVQILMYAVPVIVILFIVNIVLKRLGIKKSPKEQRKRKEVIKEAGKITMLDIFNPQYYTTISHTALSPVLAEKYAADIRKAVRWAGTNEALLFSTFKKMNSQTNISQVANYYYILYKKDMRAAIINDLSKTELSVLYKIIKSLPRVT